MKMNTMYRCTTYRFQSIQWNLYIVFLYISIHFESIQVLIPVYIYTLYSYIYSGIYTLYFAYGYMWNCVEWIYENECYVYMYMKRDGIYMFTYIWIGADVVYMYKNSCRLQYVYIHINSYRRHLYIHECIYVYIYVIYTYIYTNDSHLYI